LKKLKAAGWDICVIWECETRDAEALTARLKTFLESPRGR
jgi:DNA mismatch endonuclease (patch repair protein)